MINKFIKPAEERIYYVDSNSKYASFDFKNKLVKLMKLKLNFYNEIIILCIGTDRATGDSLGPLIGYKLNKLPLRKKAKIYGTLSNPVHAKNIDETVAFIYKNHKNPMIIAIDACLGASNHIGQITLGEGSIKPGAGVKKDLMPVGDIFITGIVNFSGIMDIVVLQNTRLDIVMKMADIITSGIWTALLNYI